MDSTNFARNGDYLAEYNDPAMAYREYARHSRRDADASNRFHSDLMRYAKFIRHFMLRTPADPTSFRPTANFSGFIQVIQTAFGGMVKDK